MDKPLSPGTDKTSTTAGSYLSSLSRIRKKLNPSFIIPETVPRYKTLPFQPIWTFGRNKCVPILNLTTSNRARIFFASSHLGIMYSYRKNKMKVLLGHRGTISSVSIDMTGRWLVTADGGRDSSFIVWNTDNLIPVHTQFNPYMDVGVRVVGISPDAKYIVTVSKSEVQKVAFWLWTFGKHEPDAQADLPSDVCAVTRITFCSDKTEHFMLTSKTRVVFGAWENHVLTLHVPNWSRDVGRLTESAYIAGSHQALTASVRGHLLVWSDVNYINSFSLNIPLTNTKYVLKIIRLIQCAIHVLKTIEEFVITSDDKGYIRFYDRRLRLLYVYQDFSHGPHLTVSFHIPEEKEFNISSEGEVDYSIIESATLSESLDIYEDLSGEIVFDYVNFHLESILLEFVVAAKDGKVALINISRKECKLLLYPSNDNVTAMDTHPERPVICVGSARGHVFYYNYIDKDINMYEKLFEKRHVSITSLKYGPSGYYIACGTENGRFWLLDSTSLLPLYDVPENLGKSPITQIVISNDGYYIALRAESNTVSLYKCFNSSGMEKEFIGRARIHHKPIRTIMFTKSSSGKNPYRLFSLGEDRTLVEYGFQRRNSLELEILSRDRIEQSAIPLTMIEYPRLDSQRFLLVANSEKKFKLMNDVTKQCRKTSLGPPLQSPVCLLELLPVNEKHSKEFLIFSTKNEIGIQIMPVDGNPYRSLAVTGHPKQVVQMCTSADKNYLFTRGENDAAVLMWYINPTPVEVNYLLGGSNLEPYYCLMDGGQEGHLFTEIQDFFTFAQMRAQGLPSQKSYKITDRVPICEIPSIMRAVGFYPTEYEIDNIIYEISYSKYASTGKRENSIHFDDFVRLLINHAPAQGITDDSLRMAFNTFAEGKNTSNLSIEYEKFTQVLRERGECFSNEQVEKYFHYLLQRANLQLPQPKHEEADPSMDDAEDDSLTITYSMFKDDILGIEESETDM